MTANLFAVSFSFIIVFMRGKKVAISSRIESGFAHFARPKLSNIVVHHYDDFSSGNRQYSSTVSDKRIKALVF